MSNNDWVQAGTPREDEWADEQDEYGVPVSPVEWDDYAAEQSVPVPEPAAAEEPLVELGGEEEAPCRNPSTRHRLPRRRRRSPPSMSRNCRSRPPSMQR